MKPQTDIKHNFVDLKYLDTPEHTQHPMLPCPGRLIPTHTHTHTLTPLLSHLWSYHPALTHKHTHTHTHTFLLYASLVSPRLRSHHLVPAVLRREVVHGVADHSPHLLPQLEGKALGECDLVALGWWW